MHKDLKEIVEALDEQGFEWRLTKSQHVRVTLDGEYVTTFAGTPSDWRSWKNSIAQAKRFGFIWPWPPE